MVCLKEEFPKAFSYTVHKLCLEYFHVLPCYQQTYLDSLSGEVLLGDPDVLLG